MICYIILFIAGTPCVTSGITNLTVSPAQPLTSHIPQAQPIVPIKVQPERSFSLAKPAAGDGNFVSKWYGFVITCMILFASFCAG